MKQFTVRPPLVSQGKIRIGGREQDDDWVLLGRLSEIGRRTAVLQDIADQHVVAIVGKRGTGKSYTLGSLLEGLCTNGDTTPISQARNKPGTLLFDTLGIFQWADIPLSQGSSQAIIQEQIAYQNGWGLDSIPLNVLIWQPAGYDQRPGGTRHRTFAIRPSDLDASDWGYLLGLDILQDRMGQLLNDAFQKVTIEGWSSSDRTYSPDNDYSLEDLIRCIRDDEEIQASYQNETKRAVVQQLSVYARNPLFSPSGTDISELLKPGVMSVIAMNKLDDSLRLVLIISIIRRIMRARIVASEQEKDLLIRGNDMSLDERRVIESELQNAIPPCWIAADEAQNFLPSERKTNSTDTLVRLVREGRNYGMSFLITTQQPTAIDSRIMSQVDTLISHKLTVQSDIDYIRRNLKSNLPSEVTYGRDKFEFEDLVRALEVGQAVVSSSDAERTMIVEIRPRVSVHGGF